jgi:hypothetical protein
VGGTRWRSSAASDPAILGGADHRQAQAHCPKALEQENSRLKKIVAEQALDISMLSELPNGKI